MSAIEVENEIALTPENILEILLDSGELSVKEIIKELELESGLKFKRKDVNSVLYKLLNAGEVAKVCYGPNETKPKWSVV